MQWTWEYMLSFWVKDEIIFHNVPDVAYFDVQERKGMKNNLLEIKNA